MRIRVEGRRILSGHYQPGGNPNAAIALLAASLLTAEPMTIRNMPRTPVTKTMLEVAQRMGSKLDWEDEATLKIETPEVCRRIIPEEETNGFVGVLLYLAPMLVRRQHARVEIPFPLNRIRTHLETLRDLGIDIVTLNGAVECQAQHWESKSVVLAQASVTATAMVLMLAATLGQETHIYNAACEPHVQALAHLLNAMGARIDGIGSNMLHVYGTGLLKGGDVTIGPDHIETASIAAIGALSGSRFQIKGTCADNLHMIDKIYRRLGIQLDIDDSAVFIPKHTELTISNREEDVDSSIETATWPGFPSDLVAIATIAATQARGTSLIHEKLFNNRLLFVDKLKAMGAQVIFCDPHRAIVVGPTPLYATYLDSPDVRAGLGMLGAALIAEGETVIDNAQVIEQTFTGVIAKLQALGAGITVE